MSSDLKIELYKLLGYDSQLNVMNFRGNITADNFVGNVTGNVIANATPLPPVIYADVVGNLTIVR